MPGPKKTKIERAIDELAEKVRQCRERGARRRFLAPLGEAEVLELEAELGVALPPEYRAFLVGVARGEPLLGEVGILEPSHGVARLGGGVTSKPFPVGEPDARRLLQALSKRKKSEAAPAVDAPMDGVLPLADHGDATYDCLVLSGPFAGTMWQAWDAGWTPLYTLRKGAAEPMSFLAWAKKSIADALAGAPPPITPETTEVILSGRGLVQVPGSVFAARGLRRLMLGGNAIESLPQELSALDRLEDIELSSNRLGRIPGWIGGFPALWRLGLSNNGLTALPDEIGALGALRELRAGDNQLTALPESIGDLSALEVLGVPNNRLAALPESLGRLARLRILHIDRNPLRRLPEALESLTLERLELSGVPELDWRHAFEVLARSGGATTLTIDGPIAGGLRLSSLVLSAVKTLSLHQVAPLVLDGDLSAWRQLEQLLLSKTGVSRIPDEIAALPNLKSLSLFGEALPPDEVERFQQRAPGVTLRVFG
jgi:Leucine-rich repeat (LRR) protein